MALRAGLTEESGKDLISELVLLLGRHWFLKLRLLTGVIGIPSLTLRVGALA